jgi:hypothetical protein
MLRSQKIKLVVALLPVHQVRQKLTPITCHKLSCQLYNVPAHRLMHVLCLLNCVLITLPLFKMFLRLLSKLVFLHFMIYNLHFKIVVLPKKVHQVHFIASLNKLSVALL